MSARVQHVCPHGTGYLCRRCAEQIYGADWRALDAEGRTIMTANTAPATVATILESLHAASLLPALNILQWREFGDDDDSLDVRLVLPGEDATIIVGWENSLPWGDGDTPETAFTVAEQKITDGEILRTSDGRAFRVTFTEVEGLADGAPGKCVDCGTQCVSGGEGSVVCPKCDLKGGE